MSVRTRDPQPTSRPSWEQYWAGVGDENYLFARELIEVTDTIRRHFDSYIAWREKPCMVEVPGAESWDPGVPDPEGWVWRDAHLDWVTAAREADEWPCSSTERRMLDLVLSLVQPDAHWDGDQHAGIRTINAQDLAGMGSWRDEVAEILCRYITGAAPKAVSTGSPACI